MKRRIERVLLYSSIILIGGIWVYALANAVTLVFK